MELFGLHALPPASLLDVIGPWPTNTGANLVHRSPALVFNAVPPTESIGQHAIALTGRIGGGIRALLRGIRLQLKARRRRLGFLRLFRLRPPILEEWHLPLLHQE